MLIKRNSSVLGQLCCFRMSVECHYRSAAFISSTGLTPLPRSDNRSDSRRSDNDAEPGWRRHMKVLLPVTTYVNPVHPIVAHIWRHVYTYAFLHQQLCGILYRSFRMHCCWCCLVPVSGITCCCAANHVCQLHRAFYSALPDTLDWLPVWQWITDEITSMEFSSNHGPCPTYFMDVCIPVHTVAGAYVARRDLIMPQVRTKIIEPQGFLVSRPVAWNSLPRNLQILDILRQVSVWPCENWSFNWRW